MLTLDLRLQKQLRDVFATLTSPVTLAVFTRESTDNAACYACEDTVALARGLAELSDGKVLVEVHDVSDADQAGVSGIDKTPAIAVLGDGRHDFGIRFFGAPGGYEFGTLIEDIRMVGTGAVDLAPQTIEALASLTTPLHIQVFVTPTCPYCPRAVLLAHKMAAASDHVTADAIDASEFPDLADRYRVYGVPRTVVNETVQIEGAVPENVLMDEIRSSLEAWP